jgi:hypothetical protein
MACGGQVAVGLASAKIINKKRIEDYSPLAARNFNSYRMGSVET